MSKPTVVTTFAGCGGSSLGYKMSGFDVRLAVEWDDHAVECYRLNFPDTQIHHGDIGKLSVDDALGKLGIAPGELDVLDGSPPCQGFSTVGRRDFGDDRNQLFREYVRLLRGLRPRVFVMENVSGMVRGKMRLIFVEVLRELGDCGYWVSCKLMNAMYFGVPQHRRRLIFVGLRRDFSERMPQLSMFHPRPKTRVISVRDAIGDFATKEAPADLWFSEEEKLKAERHRQAQRAKGNSFQFRLLNLSRPAPTITKMEIKITSQHILKIGRAWRLLTIDEAKALHSFPVGFRLSGTFSKQWARIGNSVPPLFMKAIAEHVKGEILAKVGSSDGDDQDKRQDHAPGAGPGQEHAQP